MTCSDKRMKQNANVCGNDCYELSGVIDNNVLIISFY